MLHFLSDSHFFFPPMTWHSRGRSCGCFSLPVRTGVVLAANHELPGTELASNGPVFASQGE